MSLHPAVVKFDQVSQQRQTYAQAALGPGNRLLPLHEEIEDLRQHLRIDSLAVVRDADHRLPVDASKLEPYTPANRGILGRVAEEVRLDLLKAGWIATHEHDLVTDVHGELRLPS